MNSRLVIKLIGNILIIEALFMFFPLLVSLIYGRGDHTAFIFSLLITAVAGASASSVKPKDNKIRTRDAFTATALSWIIISCFGALPYYFSGCFSSVIDCVFESVSGFTTTGATILIDVEIMPEGILFWRSMSQWMGGLGILLLIPALMPSIHASSVNILRAELTGPSPHKIVPGIRETAKIIYTIYFVMTAVLFILLLISGLSVFDSLISTFSTAGTGGVSNKNASVGAFGNASAEIILTVFMFLFGISFSLYYLPFAGDLKKLVKDEELRLYLGMAFVCVIIITINTSGIYGGFLKALRYTAFQVSAAVSTTGFIDANFSLWPAMSQILLIFLMFTGSCAGSTGGGIKIVRGLLLFKMVKVELHKVFHPDSVKTVKLNGKKINPEIVSKAALFFFLYFAILLPSTALIAADSKDILTSAEAVFASLNNIGPEFGLIGAAGSYYEFSVLSKIILSFNMVAGRLEIIPVLVLFTPAAWKKT
ncbi:MAG: TrkH family potassium uptake protein [Oscillospiraceae bacterium]|nr:TrkH family potassium uptake protein [Oscillospiraceae bacterium]